MVLDVGLLPAPRIGYLATVSTACHSRLTTGGMEIQLLGCSSSGESNCIISGSGSFLIAGSGDCSLMGDMLPFGNGILAASVTSSSTSRAS